MQKLKTFEIREKGHFIYPFTPFDLPLDANIIDVQFIKNNNGSSDENFDSTKLIIVYTTDNEENLSNYQEGIGFAVNRYHIEDSIPKRKNFTDSLISETIFEKVFILENVVNLVRIDKFYRKRKKGVSK